MNSYRLTEAQFQQAVLDLAKLRGWLWFHDYDSRRNPAGFLDFVFVHPRTGQLLFRELKTDIGRVTPGQLRWIESLRLGGHDAGVWRPEHFASGAIAAELTPTRRAAVLV